MQQRFRKLLARARRIGLAAILLAAGIAGVSQFHVRPARAASGFSLSSVKGTYGYMIQGQMGATRLGLLTADGNGGISGSDIVQAFGGTQTQPFQGSYTVNNDGTGTMTLNYPAPPAPPQPPQDPDNPTPVILPPPPIAHYNFVLVNGRTLRAISSDRNVFATGDFTLQ
jgi:hypothetical protein